MSSDEREDRLNKLHELRERGIRPFAYSYDRTHMAGDITEGFDDHEGDEVSVAGRVYAIRTHGALTFMDLHDPSGEIQIYVSRDDIGDEEYETISTLFDRGDIIGVRGEVMKTKKGEISVKAEDVEMLTKCLYPIPSTKSGLEDTEVRYRQRYLDMIVNPEVREIFETRTEIVRGIREFLDSHGYIEVETPILQPIYGGALARPFKTHHNSLDMEMYLRIANELYLKRLVVGGFERVYEIAKDFRNEGLDTTHNPEFTQVEFYQAYVDYEYMMDFTEKLIQHVAERATGSLQIEYQGEEIDLSSPWKRMTMEDAVREAGIETKGKSVDELREKAGEHDLELESHATRGEIVEALFEEFVEPNIVQPTFIMDYPVEVSPLAKRHREDPEVTERFELFIAGREFGNSFSELNDPIDQRERFEEQVKMREEGHDEAHEMDEDFVTSLECAMPPTGGVGIGIDRLTMLLTDQTSIKEVILFPQMKKRNGTGKDDGEFGDEVKEHVIKKRE